MTGPRHGAGHAVALGTGTLDTRWRWGTARAVALRSLVRWGPVLRADKSPFVSRFEAMRSTQPERGGSGVALVDRGAAVALPLRAGARRSQSVCRTRGRADRKTGGIGGRAAGHRAPRDPSGGDRLLGRRCAVQGMWALRVCDYRATEGRSLNSPAGPTDGPKRSCADAGHGKGRRANAVTGRIEGALGLPRAGLLGGPGGGLRVGVV